MYYGHTMKETVTLTFLYGKENGVVMSDSWMKNECAATMWLRGLRIYHESLCLKKPQATTLTQSTMKTFSENLKELKTTVS
jgi:hypothetical protein